jgi:pimeloyl-ACP methyl ester carboxylesterase
MYFIQKVVLAPNGYGGKFFENFKTRENVESILLQQGVYGDTTNVNDELLEILLGPSDDDGAKEVFLKVFGGPAGPTPEEFLRDIECPILALWGDSDPWVPVNRGRHQGLNFGDYTKAEYKLEILQGVGHCPHDEVPLEIHQKMLPWLQSVSCTP